MRYTPKVATFRGVHNKTKVAILLTLFDRERQGLGGLNLGELAQYCPMPYASLKVTVGKLSRPGWLYIQKHLSKNNKTNKPCFSYSIAERGVRFLKERTPAEVIQQVAAQIREYRKTGGKTNGSC